MKVCPLCGAEHDLVVGEWCDSCTRDALAQLAQMELGDELADAVAAVVEFATAREGAVDRSDLRAAWRRMEDATGAATTRQQAVELAAWALIFALQIPTRGHSLDEERRVREVVTKQARGHNNTAGRDRWMKIAEQERAGRT